MRKFALGMVTVVMVSIGAIVLVAAWNSDPDSPIEVAQRMIGGLERRDASDLQRAFCDPDLAQLVIDSSQGRIRFADLHFAEAPHPIGGVAVTITGHKGTSEDREEMAWTAWLQESGGEWCITSLDTRNQPISKEF